MRYVTIIWRSRSAVLHDIAMREIFSRCQSCNSFEVAREVALSEETCLGRGLGDRVAFTHETLSVRYAHLSLKFMRWNTCLVLEDTNKMKRTQIRDRREAG